MEPYKKRRGTQDTTLGKKNLNAHSHSCTFPTFLICTCWQSSSFRIYTRLHHLPSWTARGLRHPSPFHTTLFGWSVQNPALLHLLSPNAPLTKTACKGLSIPDQSVQPLTSSPPVQPHCAHHEPIHQVGTADEGCAPTQPDSCCWHSQPQAKTASKEIWWVEDQKTIGQILMRENFQICI